MKKRIFALLAVVLLVSMLLVSCSSKGGYNGVTSDEAPQAPGGAYDSVDGGFYGEAELGVIDAAAGSSSGAEMPSLAEEGLKIIYTAYVDIQTKEFQESLDALLTMLRENAGYVQDSSVSGGYTSDSGYYYNRYADLTLRVPADSYRAFLDAAGSVGTVTNLNEYTDDITATYIDTEARLKSLNAQEERLLELLAAAELMEDLIQIESKLAEVRYQIESYQSQMNTYNKLISYATVTISLQEVSSVTMPKETFGQRIAAAFQGSGTAVVEFLEKAVIVLIYLLPFLLIALVIFIVVRVVVKKTAPKRQAKRAAAIEHRRAAANYTPSPYAQLPDEPEKEPGAKG